MKKNKMLVAVLCAFAVSLVCLVSMASAAETPQQVVDESLSKWYDNYIATPGMSSEEVYVWPWITLFDLNKLPNPQLGDQVSVVLFSKETPRPINYKVVEVDYPNVGKVLVWAADGVSTSDPSRVTVSLGDVMDKAGDDYDYTYVGTHDDNQGSFAARVGGFTIHDETVSTMSALREFVYEGGTLSADDPACPVYLQKMFSNEISIGIDVEKWNALFDASANPNPTPEPNPTPNPTPEPSPTPNPTPGNSGSGGGGCNAGFAAGLLLLGACAFLKKR